MKSATQIVPTSPINTLGLHFPDQKGGGGKSGGQTAKPAFPKNVVLAQPEEFRLAWCELNPKAPAQLDYILLKFTVSRGEESLLPTLPLRPHTDMKKMTREQSARGAEAYRDLGRQIKLSEGAMVGDLVTDLPSAGFIMSDAYMFPKPDEGKHVIVLAFNRKGKGVNEITLPEKHRVELEKLTGRAWVTFIWDNSRVTGANSITVNCAKPSRSKTYTVGVTGDDLVCEKL